MHARVVVYWQFYNDVKVNFSHDWSFVYFYGIIKFVKIIENMTKKQPNYFYILIYVKRNLYFMESSF